MLLNPGQQMVENLQTRGFEPIVMDLNKDAVAAISPDKPSQSMAAPLIRFGKKYDD